MTCVRIDRSRLARSFRRASTRYGAATIAAIGAGVIVYGAMQFRRAFGNEYRRHLELHRMDAGERTMARHVSRTGLSTRGAIYVLAGIFMISAACNADPSQAHDPGGVLAVVASQPYGAILLAAIALGLLAYAGYAVFQAFYRRL
jgi:hypothetical protein